MKSFYVKFRSMVRTSINGTSYFKLYNFKQTSRFNEWTRNTERLLHGFMDSSSPHITTALYSSVAEPEVKKSKLLEKMGFFVHVLLLFFFSESHIIPTCMYCYKLITLCCAVHFMATWGWYLFKDCIHSFGNARD